MCTIDVLHFSGVPTFSCGCYFSFLLLVRSEKDFLFYPRLEVSRLSSPLLDIVIENIFFRQMAIPFDIVMETETVWSPALADYLPFSNCSISQETVSAVSYGLIILT